MQDKTLTPAFLFMLLITVLAVISWEIHLRHTGLPLAYDDGKENWADKRARVYDPPEKTTVFIGSSRIKFDLDIDTWQTLTGRQAIQLSEVGSSPIHLLEDLANDPAFHGRLVVDVTEPLFFSNAPQTMVTPDAAIAYYKKETPAQKASFAINHVLESQLFFLDRDAYSLNALLDRISLPNRPDVFVFPTFPIEFDRTTFARQAIISPAFLADTTLQRQVKNIWLFVSKMGKGQPRPKGDPIGDILAKVKTAVDKIRARGGEVVFVRTPDSAPFPGGEQSIFPRVAMWDRILSTTQSQGFYFTDNPATAHFVCPEWSHLQQSDAVLYTKALIAELPTSFTLSNPQ